MGSKNQTTTTAPNPQAGAAYSGLLNKAADVASTPYQAYTGELVAPVNAQQNLGIGNINQGAGFAQPYIQQAAGYANNAAQPLTAEDIARYSDPYTQQVINATESQFAHDNAVQQQGVLGNAAAQNALGGNRVGVAQALTAEGQQRAQAPVIAGLRSQGYNTGLNTAMNQQQQQAQAAYSLGNLGVAGQNAYLTGANAQIGAGTLQQGTQQALNAANYGQFTQAQAFPYQQTQWQAGIDTGVGSQMGGTTTKPGPSVISQIAGLGAAGLGAYLGYKPQGGSTDSNPAPAPAYSSAQYWAPNPYQTSARGGRIAGFDSGGPVMPYGAQGMPYAGAGPSWMPQGQITHGRGYAGVAGGMEEAPSSPGVAKMMQDATILARKFMQPGGQAFGGAVSPPSDNSIMIPRGYEDGGTPTMAGFGDGSMVPDFGDRPPSQWDSGKLREVPTDPSSFAPGTFGMASPEDHPPDPYIGGRDEAYRAAMAAAGDDSYGANEARAGVGDSSPEAPTAGVGNAGGWSSGIGPALMSAGFGMMASQSPHIGTAIGEGGLAGLKTYTEGQQREVANRRAEATMARQGEQTDIQRKGLDLRAKQQESQSNIQQKMLDQRVKDLQQRRDQAQAALAAQTENRAALQKQHEEDQAEKKRQFGIQNDPDQIRERELAKKPVALDPQSLRMAGESYFRTGQLPPGMGRSPQDRNAIMGEGYRIAAENGVDPKDLPKRWQQFGTEKVAIQRFMSGKQGDVVRSLNVATDHLHTLRELGDALKNGNYPMVNNLFNKIGEMTGQPAPTNYNAASQIVGTEVLKAVGLSGAGSVEDRAKIAKSFSSGLAPAQMNGVIDDVVRPLMVGQLRGMKGQFIPATGLPAERFDEMLLPTTKEWMSGQHGAPTPTAPPRPASVPVGSAYSKSLNQWRTPDGKIFNADGSPAQ